METVALITDIHGNSPALKAVLSEIDQRGDVTRIYCSGDLIGIGPDTNEILQIASERQNFFSISGNHDEAILAIVKGEAYPKSHEKAKKHHQWIAEQLDSRYVSFLEKLPRQIKTTLGQTKALITHYHYQNKALPISQDPFSSIVEPTLTNIEHLFSDDSETFITFGHHHPTHYYHTLTKWFVNPGSLGCHVKAEARYALVHIFEEGLICNLHAVPYDRDRWLKQYETYNVPDRDYILKVFHGQ